MRHFSTNFDATRRPVPLASAQRCLFRLVRQSVVFNHADLLAVAVHFQLRRALIAFVYGQLRASGFCLVFCRRFLWPICLPMGLGAGVSVASAWRRRRSVGVGVGCGDCSARGAARAMRAADDRLVEQAARPAG